MIKMAKRDLIRDDCLQFRAIPKITMRTSRSMDPFGGDVPQDQELPVPANCLHRIQLLPGKHLRRRTPRSVRRPEFYRSPDSSLILLPRQVHLERRSHRGHLSRDQGHPGLHHLHASQQTMNGPLIMTLPLHQLLVLCTESGVVHLQAVMHLTFFTFPFPFLFSFLHSKTI